MLVLDKTLPQGALIGGSNEALIASLGRAGGRWFLADADALECGDDLAITGWRSQTPGDMAVPAEPNRGHSFYSAAPPLAGLKFVAERNCGFVVGGITADASRFSVAVRYAGPLGGMRTLVTMNMAARKNYLFLMETDGQINFKSQDNTGGVAMAAAGDPGPRWVIAGYSTGTYFVAEPGGPVHLAKAQKSDIGGAGDLFIGCRSHRTGLVKTLGEGVIAEVLYWPVNILDASDPDARDQRAAFETHALWSS
jgi:hypothetical protein